MQDDGEAAVTRQSVPAASVRWQQQFRGNGDSLYLRNIHTKLSLIQERVSRQTRAWRCVRVADLWDGIHGIVVIQRERHALADGGSFRVICVAYG